jgi:CBS domain-containing protein
MLRRRCSRLPVIESGKVVGVVSRHDVVRALFSQNEGADHGPASRATKWIRRSSLMGRCPLLIQG